MTISAEQKWTETVLSETQSCDDRKAQLDNLEQKLLCTRCGQLGQQKDDNDCQAKVKIVGREQCSTTSSLSSAHGAEARALAEGVWITPEAVEGTKEDCSSKLVGELGMVSCVSGDSNSLETCRRSSCMSPMRVFCTSSGLRISRALRMCATMYRTWTTPSSVITATRRCGQPTRALSSVRRALYSVLEIPSERSLASQMVLCQEHSLSASPCNVQHQRLVQSTV